MKILICTVGSHGDLLPFIAIGWHFQERGHEVRLYASAAFEPLVRAAGIPCTSVGTDEQHQLLLRDPDVAKSEAGVTSPVDGVRTFPAAGFLRP